MRLTESTYRHQANIDDEVVSMEILDTAGQVSTIVRRPKPLEITQNHDGEGKPESVSRIGNHFGYEHRALHHSVSPGGVCYFSQNFRARFCKVAIFCNVTKALWDIRRGGELAKVLRAEDKHAA